MASPRLSGARSARKLSSVFPTHGPPRHFRLPPSTPMDLGIVPLDIKHMLESKPIHSRFFAHGLA